MKKMIGLLPLAALAACTQAPAAPAPDAAAVERLVERMEAEPAASVKTQGKLQKAERLATVVERADPEKLGSAAERILGR